jgi:death-on-curing protein
MGKFEVEASLTYLAVRRGGSPGVRDRGLLESAIYRAQSGYYENLEEMAAALFESLLINRPFVDDNRRVAFFATDVFLRLNGWKISVDAQAVHSFLMERFQSGICDFECLLPWIRGALVRNRDLGPGSSPG